MTSVVNDVQNVGHTFSSWNTCMSKAYCKWPVIAAIIIGCLIVFSVLWCIFSCLCCGVSLCTACTKCLTCGGCCGCCKGGGGGSRRRKDPEYHPMPPTPTPYTGYQPPSAPMMYNHTGPQFATFETGTKRSANDHEDSLPAMPSWENATTRRVEDTSPHPHGSDVEMEHMLPQSQHHAPTSPVHERPYSQTQAYSSDLGAQRLDQQAGYHNNYYDTPQPLSPAPTYYSTVPNHNIGVAVAPPPHDHFSPQHDQYHHPYDNRDMTGSVAPYPSSRESTQFTAHRSISPPSAPSYSPYQSLPLEQSQGNRPPSLLQVGRKPVAGTYREV